MNVAPLLSIIVPNFNHAPFLKQRLDSIFNQTFQDFEVILLDDCSTDKSLDLLESYADNKKVSHLLKNTQNSGSPFKQWQKGVDHAKGKFIWIAESDDYCDTHFLGKTLSLYNENNTIGLMYSQSTDVDSKSRILSHRIDYTNSFNPNIWEKDFTISGQIFINKYLSFKNVIPNASSVIFRKSLVTRDIFTDNLINMKTCGDWLFWIKIALTTDVGFISEELNYFRLHESVSRNHNSPEKRIRRMKEEKLVRWQLRKMGFDNFEANMNYYASWFVLFRKFSIFTKSFLRGKLNGTSYVSYYYYYFQFIKKNYGSR